MRSLFREQDLCKTCFVLFFAISVQDCPKLYVTYNIYISYIQVLQMRICN